MNLTKIQKKLNKTSRLLGDVKAVKNGTINKRVKNRLVGRKPLAKLFR